QLSNAFSTLGDEEPDKQKQSILLVFAFAYTIMKHHSSNLDDLSSETRFDKINGELCEKLKTYLVSYNLPFASEIVAKLPIIRSHIKFKRLGFEWFLLVRLNFSLLTAADYYAT